MKTPERMTLANVRNISLKLVLGLTLLAGPIAAFGLTHLDYAPASIAGNVDDVDVG